MKDGATAASAGHVAAFLGELSRTRALAVVRGLSPDLVLAAARALHDGGLRLVEVTTDSPGWEESIALLRRHEGAGDSALQVGVGTVMDPDQARRAVQAGATFLVSPFLSLEVARCAAEAGLAYLPGAFSPAELFAAHSASSTCIKLFPADILGPQYVTRLLQPMPFLKLVATGGVTVETAPQYLQAGAAGVALGGRLVDADALRNGDAGPTREAARRLMAAVGARGSWGTAPQ